MEFTVSQQDREWLEQTEERLLGKLSAEARRTGGKIVYIPKDGRYEDLATPHRVLLVVQRLLAGDALVYRGCS